MFKYPGRDEVTVVIDHVAGIGTFVETEVIAPDPVAAAALLGEVEQQLGLTDYPVVNLPTVAWSCNTTRRGPTVQAG